jgi:hypothetical protein
MRSYLKLIVGAGLALAIGAMPAWAANFDVQLLN